MKYIVGIVKRYRHKGSRRAAVERPTMRRLLQGLR